MGGCSLPALRRGKAPTEQTPGSQIPSEKGERALWVSEKEKTISACGESREKPSILLTFDPLTLRISFNAVATQ